MKKTEKLKVMFRGRPFGLLSRTPDNRLNVFEYDKSWLTDGFSISPLELPLKPGVFVAKPQPFYGNFGVFEDSLPDGTVDTFFTRHYSVMVETIRLFPLLTGLHWLVTTVWEP